MLSRAYQPGPVKPLHLGGVACVLAVALGVLGLSLVPRMAGAADASYDGAWTMSAITESFIVQRWGPPCGPAPVSGTMLPAGPVTIRGDRGELAILGDRRAWRTDQCLDAMPTLAQETHSHDSRSWRSRCSTPPSDPRHAVVNTAFFIAPGDDQISIAETGRYEFTISGERCVADVRRGASLSRLAAPAASPWAAPPSSASARTLLAVPQRAAPAAVPQVDCDSPGEPARLEVRPSRKLLRLCETFPFQGVVVDANGCPTGAPIVWTVGPVTFGDGQPHDARPSGDSSGRLTVPLGDFADARFDVIAASAGRAARASG